MEALLQHARLAAEEHMSANGIAVVGAGMIGAAHAFGYRMHIPRFDAALPGLVLSTVCDANLDLAASLAATYGFARAADDWKRVLADPSIGIVSICLPNFLHADVMEAALDAGKHVICEKPLAVDAATARRLYDKARSTGTRAATVFNYRRIPAVAEIRDRIRKREIGDPVHVTIQYQSEYAADPDLPHSWRYERSRAGAGALLDVGTHAIDTARYLCGDVVEVCGAMSTISVKERYLPAGSLIGHNRAELSGEKRTVDNDDVVSALLKFENGCQGMFSASRVAVGMGNTLSFAISGSRGTVRYTSERPGQFEIAVSDGSGFSAFATIPNRPASPYASLLPVPHDGVAVGYAESFGFMINEFLAAIVEGREVASGSLLDGLRAAEILDAIHMAADEGHPVAVDRHAPQ
jgi:predicted dehydrogenase